MAKSNNNEAIKKLTEGDYKYGFVRFDGEIQ